MAATRSAIMMVGALVLPDVIVGITDASMTRSPARPWTRNCGSTTARVPLPMAAVPTGWKMLLAIAPMFLLVRRLPTRANVWPIVWCGLLDAVGFAFFAFAASIGPLSVASVTATQWGTAAALIFNKLFFTFNTNLYYWLIDLRY